MGSMSLAKSVIRWLEESGADVQNYYGLYGIIFAEREEGIVPLTDSFPQAHLSHAHQSTGLCGIVTEPANLESTSLVFALGLDLFYTQIAPSRSYDSLTEEFNYALLLITIVVLLIGILVTYV